MVGDAGGSQLREASLTSAAVPTGALAAQAVLLTSVGRQHLLLSFGEEAPLPHYTGVPTLEPPSLRSQSLRSNWDPRDTLTSTKCWLDILV